MHSPNAIEAATLLQDVAEEHRSFWFNHGVIAKNLNELSAALDDMNEPEFSYHVRAEGNDIATWVDAVIGDRVLASKLHLLSTLEATRRMVSRRVEELTAALPVVKTVEDVTAEQDVALVKAVVAAPAPVPEMAMAEAAPAAESVAAVSAKSSAAKKSPSARKAATKTVAKKTVAPAPVKKSSLFGRLLKR